VIQTATVMSDYLVITSVSRCTNVPRDNYTRRIAFNLLGAGSWVITYFMRALVENVSSERLLTLANYYF
jgi:hypothetical protein